MRTLFTCLAVAALAACGRPDPVASDAQNTSALPSANTAAPSPTGGPPTNVTTSPASTSAPPAPAGTLPAALQGRWGLTPGDCTTSLGDAKGLLVVNSGELRFYESRAVPSPGIKTSPDSVSGNFAFTGEGQNWTKYETLELRDGKLVRTERDPGVSFTYVRCG
jgi:hypothetical protein